MEHHLHVGDSITPYRTNLDGCGYVVAKASTIEHSIELAAKVRQMHRYNYIKKIIMYKHFLKRLLDIVFSLLVFPLFGLILIPVAIAIKLDDGGPVFYKSARVGKGFQKFNMLKFRSMKVNAPDLRNVDGGTYNSANDSRVTKIGKF